MIRIRKSLLYFISFVIFIFAIVAGLSRIGVFDRVTKSSKIDFSRATTLFEQAQNNTKITMTFTSSELSQIKNAVSQITSTDQAKIKVSDSGKHYYSAVITFHQDALEQVLDALRSIKGLQEEHIHTAPDAAMEMDVQAHLDARKLVKQRLEKDLQNASRLSEQNIANLSASLSRVQSQIDSLNSKVATMQYNSSMAMLMLTVVDPGAMNGTDLIGKLQTFALTVLMVLIAELVVLLFFYLVIVLIFKLSPMLGIKPMHSSSSNYNYNYKRSSGKKIKRIYKDEEGNTVEK